MTLQKGNAYVDVELDHLRAIKLHDITGIIVIEGNIYGLTLQRRGYTIEEKAIICDINLFTSRQMSVHVLRADQRKWRDEYCGKDIQDLGELCVIIREKLLNSTLIADLGSVDLSFVNDDDNVTIDKVERAQQQGFISNSLLMKEESLVFNSDVVLLLESLDNKNHALKS